MKEPIKHEFNIEDLNHYELTRIKEAAIQKFVHSREARQAPLIISCFMEYLSREGYKIVKEEHLNGSND